MKLTKKQQKPALNLDAFKAKASKTNSKQLLNAIVGGVLANCHGRIA